MMRPLRSDIWDNADGAMFTIHRMQRGNVTVALAASDLQPASSACPVCGSTALAHKLGIQADPAIAWFACNSCRCWFASPQPTPEYLEGFYGGYYAQNDGERVHVRPTRLAHRILDGIGLPATEHVRILDFGGGDGAVGFEVARQLHARGTSSADVVVVDYNHVPNPQIPPWCTARYHRELSALVDAEPFHLIVASAVLEHVLDLKAALGSLWAVMARSGWFYARTPYVGPLAAALRRIAVRFDMNYPGHLFDLGAEFWDSALPRLGGSPGYVLRASRPSLVETQWRDMPLQTAAAYLLKSPYRLLGRQYPFVGGWEVLIQRT